MGSNSNPTWWSQNVWVGQHLRSRACHPLYWPFFAALGEWWWSKICVMQDGPVMGPVEAVHSLNGFAPSRWTEDPWTNLITKHLANSSWVRSCDCCVCIVCIFYQGNFLQNQMRRRQDHKVNGNAHVQKIYPNNSKYSLHMFAEYVYILSIVLSIVFVQIALPATQTGSWKFEIFWHQRRYESRCTE